MVIKLDDWEKDGERKLKLLVRRREKEVRLVYREQSLSIPVHFMDNVRRNSAHRTVFTRRLHRLLSLPDDHGCLPMFNRLYCAY